MTHPSEAHRRIAALVDAHGPAWLERQLGLADGTVRGWMRGRSPQRRIRDRVAERLAIGAELWTTLPGAEMPAPPPSPAPAPPEPPRSDATPDGAPAARPPIDPEDARANVLAVLAILRSRLERLPPDDVDALPRLANAVTSSTRLLARLSGQLDVTEAQILRSAAWVRLQKTLREVLSRFPGASEALVSAMADYERT